MLLGVTPQMPAHLAILAFRLSLPLLADAPMPQEGKLLSADTLKQAVAGAHWIQESVPERLDIKHKVLGDIQTECAPEAIIGSSTSGFKPSALGASASNVYV